MFDKIKIYKKNKNVIVYDNGQMIHQGNRPIDRAFVRRIQEQAEETGYVENIEEPYSSHQIITFQKISNSA